MYMNTFYNIISSFFPDIDLKHTEIKDFIENKLEINYLKSLKILDTIKFQNSIKMLEDINSIFFIFSNISSPNNTTGVTLTIRG